MRTFTFTYSQPTQISAHFTPGKSELSFAPAVTQIVDTEKILADKLWCVFVGTTAKNHYLERKTRSNLPILRLTGITHYVGQFIATTI